MLMNGQDLLAVANENNFAVPAFNISDYAMGKGIFEICEKLNAPLIVAIHPDEVATSAATCCRRSSSARTARPCRSRSTGTTAAPTSRCSRRSSSGSPRP